VKRPAKTRNQKEKKNELIVDFLSLLPYIFWRISNMAVAARFIESDLDVNGKVRTDVTDPGVCIVA
jgi:hypothetical protein